MGLLKKERGIAFRTGAFIVSMLFLLSVFLLLGPKQVTSQEEQEQPIDDAGLMALRLWEEGERDQAIEKAARLYWDYWFTQPSPYYSTYDLWFRHEQTRKWLKDPKHNMPPPPPPMPPYTFLSPPLPPSPFVTQYPYPGTWPYPYPYTTQYPYPSYYPSPYSMSPQFWSPPPYYHLPRHNGKPGGKGKR